MKLKINNMNTLVDIYSGINMLCIENGALLYKVASELSQDPYNKEYFSLLNDDYKEIESVYYDFVSDVFNLEFNNRKNQTYLNKIMMKQINGSSLENEIFDYSKKINEAFKEYMLDFIIPVEINEEVTTSDVLKLLNVRIKEEYNNLIEKIVAYMKITNKIRKVNSFIFLNLTQFLTIEDIENIDKDLKYDNISLILLENTIIPEKIIKNRLSIIDESLDLLY